MADRLLCRVVGGGGEHVEVFPIESLSDRELEVFELIGQGQQECDRREVAPEQQDRQDLPGPDPAETGFEHWLPVRAHALLWVLENA